MDIKAEIEKLVEKFTKDSALQEKFKADPAGTVRGLVGDKADNDTISKIVDAVKAALASGKLGAIGEKISGMLGGILGGKAEDQPASEEKPES